MKHIRNFFIFIIALIISISLINTKTDFFYNMSDYIPPLNEYPLAKAMISDASKSLADLTSSIPTISEFIALIKHERPPIDPSDVAQNAYIEDSPMLSFYPPENIGFVVDSENGTINIFGSVASSQKKYILANFSDEANEQLEQISVSVNSDMTFNKIFSIPESDYNSLELIIFTSPWEYGQYTSWVLNTIHLIRDENGDWILKPSPVYEHNKEMFELEKSISEALKSTPSIQSDFDEIISAAQAITADCQTNYDKAAAIHDWICENVYYDEDNINTEEILPYYATDVLRTRHAVCLGISTLYAALCRSIGIPCNVVSGYALGINEEKIWTDENINTDYQNHAWNEVYVDGRWVIVDATWDTQNRIRNYEYVTGDEVSHLFFDSNLRYFSQSHKIIEYIKRR